jgi:hypothetical protein
MDSASDLLLRDETTPTGSLAQLAPNFHRTTRDFNLFLTFPTAGVMR